jgi:selenide,water dikinase
VLADPQTSGGLLIAVAPEGKKEVEALLRVFGIEAQSLGTLTEKREKVIYVE